MNIKIIFTILAIITGVSALFPYFRDIFLLKTKPHAYTWLIWAITQGTAAAGVWYGGGGFGAINLTIGAFFVAVIFLFSLKYGTKNITISDTIILIAAFLAIVVWWQLNQPLISIIMVSIIDMLGYIPSLRKTYYEPWSETLSSWIVFSISNVFVMLSLNEYNFLTMVYLVAITIANMTLFLLCFFRRQVILKPQ